ncbi:unnamed protein product [Vitrella brassicaformis CCMP3155]|uniref:Photosystem II protein Y n=2 Tax=Sar TaxID=2698737 RepID=A0A0G4FA21_VITBC|nr:unnamed protein product [Vitrella brassicaformis CCMP3155]|mmetsp:Transcript_45590/g.128719  ORF Transcript_45590/g.128719 Transcript_45590/m.128719 type:complete len:126 (-) Transcript_45590:487-864(-)|eukprot:CEM09730.1 unnamed protein product [Vitrella brassicaformis CCMP3155]
MKCLLALSVALLVALAHAADFSRPSAAFVGPVATSSSRLATRMRAQRQEPQQQQQLMDLPQLGEEDIAKAMAVLSPLMLGDMAMAAEQSGPDLRPLILLSPVLIAASWAFFNAGRGIIKQVTDKL